MIYRGRHLDPVALWEKYVEFPQRMVDSGFAPKVRCPNPEHDTMKKHFQVNLDEPLVHCFANCGISGTYEHAIAMIEGVTTREARRVIVGHTGIAAGSPAKRSGRKRTRNGIPSASTEKPVPRPSLEFDNRIPQHGLDYLAGRGITSDSVAAFEIGYDPDSRRIVIPADDERGTRRFLIKRAVRERDWPKYLYWPEKEDCGWGKTDLVFGACHIDRDRVRSQGIVLVEGSFDAVKLHQYGVRNAGAILGTKLSERQARIIAGLRPRRVYCMFDKDAAGWRNIQSVAEMLRKVPIFVCLYPRDKHDPAELSRREVERAIERAIPLLKFLERIPKSLRDKVRRQVAYG